LWVTQIIVLWRREHCTKAPYSLLILTRWFLGRLRLPQVLGEYQQIVSGCIEVVNDGLTAIATDFVEPVRQSIDWPAGGFYEQQSAATGLDFGFHPCQQGASDTATLSNRVHNDPV